MPRLTRWFIRTGLVFLVLALSLGVIRALPGGGAWLPAAWPSYVHLLTVGWLTQLIFGVAYWMFPTDPASRAWTNRLAWWSYGLLNAGLIARLALEPVVAARGPGGLPGLGLTASAIAQALAALGMAVILWPRVRGRAR